ncbi:MAG: hypothetical protein HY289_03945 [Planctomycetes bacterium]|nr:hypothetical protein [Planctomycetota bacterium]
MDLNQWKDESMVLVERTEPIDDAVAELEEIGHAEPAPLKNAPPNPEGWPRWLWRHLRGTVGDAIWKAIVLLLALSIMTGCRAAFEWVVGRFP